MNERLNAVVGARIAEFRKKMASVKKTLKSIPKNTVTTVTVVTKEAEKRINTFQSRIARLANSIRALGTVMGNMAQGGLLIASPSMVPIIASATGALGALGPMLGTAAGGALGLGSAFTSAAGGLGGYALVANHAIGRLQALSSAMARGDVELSELPGYYQKAMKSIEGFEQVMFELRKEFTKPITETLTTFIQAGTSALDQMKPAIKSTVGAVDNLANSFKKAVNGSGAQKFFEWMGNTSGKYIERFGKSIGNLIAGFGNLMVAFDPLADSMSSGFMDMTKRFSEWTSKLSESEKFQSFISYVQTNGPKLLSTLSNVRDGLVGMFSAFGPLSADMMTGLQNLTERFKEWGQSLSDNQQFQKFIGYIRDNAPTVLALIGNITTFLVNLGIAMAPIGAKVLELVNSFFAWTSSMMEAHPWVGKLIAVGVMLAGAFMAVVPLIIALRTAFAGLPGVIIGAIGKMLPLFSQFRLIMTVGLQMLGTNLYLFGTRVMTTAVRFGTTLANMIVRVRLWATMILAQLRLTLTNWLKSFAQMIAGAAKWVAQTAVHIAKVIARFALLSAKAAIHAGKVALSFTVTMVKAAAKAAAQFAIQTAKMIAKYALLAAKSLVHAARVAASWVIAMGPVGWVIATVVGLVAIIIANWDKIKSWTVKTWNNIWDTISSIAEDIWNKITDVFNSIVDFFGGINLFDSGKAIIQSAIDGLMSMKNKIVSKVEDIVSSVRDLWPFSPAKEGPLSDIHKMDFGGPIGMSIDKARNPIMRSMANLASVARNAFTPDIAMVDIGATATLDTNINGASLNKIGAELNDFEIPERPVIVHVEGDAEWIRAYVNEGNAIDDKFRVFWG